MSCLGNPCLYSPPTCNTLDAGLACAGGAFEPIVGAGGCACEGDTPTEQVCDDSIDNDGLDPSIDWMDTDCTRGTDSDWYLAMQRRYRPGG